MGASLVTQNPVLIRRTRPNIDLLHLCRSQECSTNKLIRTCRSSLCRTVVTTVGTGVLLRTCTRRVTRNGTLVTVIAAAIELTIGTTTRTLTVTCAVTTVRTSHNLRPVITGRLEDTLLAIITRALVGVGLTLVTVSRHRSTVGVILNTTKATSRFRTPCTVRQTLLRTGVNCWICTTSHAVDVGFAIVRALAIATTQTATSTGIGAVVANTADAIRFTVVTRTARTVVRARHLTGRTLTISLGSTIGNRSRNLVVDFHITQRGRVGSTEVVATRAASITTRTTAIVMTEIAIGTACQVRVEVMTTTPSRAVSTMVVLIVTVLIPSVLIISRQREQEVTAVTCVTTSVPLSHCIATYYIIVGELNH